MDKVVNNEEYINVKIFMDYFRYYNQTLSTKNLHENNQAKNKKIVSIVNDDLIDLRNAVNKRRFLKVKIQIK